MRNLIKFICTFCAVCCSLLFSLVWVGNKIIPDNITTIDNNEYITPKIFGFSFFKSIAADKADTVLKSVQKSPTESNIMLLNIIPVKNTKINNSKRKYVVPGGEIFGIKLYTDGIVVVGMDFIDGENGSENPAQKSGLQIGDVIKKVNGKKISSINQLTKTIEKSKGDKIHFTVLRNNKLIDIVFKSVKDKSSGKYKAGLWVRDSTAGIGTVTFYNKENNSFGGLGHAICDLDTNKIMPLGNGEMAEAYINGFYKSCKGSVGELCGVFTGKSLGDLCVNNNTGIYGYMYDEVPNNNLIPVAVKQEVREGNAKIICTIDNKGPQYYDAKIVKVYSNSSSANKDMIIEITDEELLQKTGGILQGM